MKILDYILLCSSGIIAGSVVAHLIINRRKKAEQIEDFDKDEPDNDIAFETYDDLPENIKDEIGNYSGEEKIAKVIKRPPDSISFVDMVHKGEIDINNYQEYASILKKKEEESGKDYYSENENSRCIISTEEFEEDQLRDFGCETIDIFTDGVATDDNYITITDNEINDLIGADLYLELRKIFEDKDYTGEDVAYVRNEKYRCDYLITYNREDFSDFLMRHPELAGD